MYLSRFSRFRVFRHIPAERSYFSNSGVAEIFFNLSLHLLRLPDPLPLCLLFANLERGEVSSSLSIKSHLVTSMSGKYLRAQHGSRSSSLMFQKSKSSFLMVAQVLSHRWNIPVL